MMMRVILTDGQAVDLNEDHGQRVLYALTSIAATPLAGHINIARLEDGEGDVHWPPHAISHAQRSLDAAD